MVLFMERQKVAQLLIADFVSRQAVAYPEVFRRVVGSLSITISGDPARVAVTRLLPTRPQGMKMAKNRVGALWVSAASLTIALAADCRSVSVPDCERPSRQCAVWAIAA